MIRGLEVFKNYFRDFSDQYVIIGGAACDIVFSDANSSLHCGHLLNKSSSILPSLYVYPTKASSFFAIPIK